MKKTVLLPLMLLLGTALQAQTTMLAEGFNVTARTATPPSGWTVSSSGTGYNDGGSCSSATTWEQVPSGGFSANCGAPGNPLPSSYLGSGMMGYNSWSITTPSATELVTPSLDFSAAGTYQLSVWIYQELNYNPGDDSLEIYVNTAASSAGSNSTLLWAGTPSYSSNSYWTNYLFNVPSTYTGTTNYFIFRGVTNYRNDIFFDSVTVIHNPPTPCTGTPLAPVMTTPVMSASSPICTGSSKTLTATDPNFPTIGGFNYQWQSAPSATGPWTTQSTVTSITGGSLSYAASPTTTTWYRLNILCVASTNSAATTPYQLFVGAPQPGAITGNASFCPGDTATYSVPTTGGTTYTWTLPSGWTGSSTTNSIKVTPNSTAGTLSVTATTACGTSVPQTKSIVAGTAPIIPGVINGNNSPCGSTNQTYTTSGSAMAISYTWNVPSGWSISSTANGGKSMTAVAGLGSGSITVTANNGCGSSTRSFAVNVISTLDTPSAITGNKTPCSGKVYTYSIRKVSGASSYVWTLPSGWSGSNTDTSIQVYPGNSGALSVTAYSPCATSPVSSTSITVQPAV
ncbi:MAG: hypothetical protein JST06_03390, partial [Bacteroidetes bacterium]|nr:hypothetical protein [Bacteroidota bacterium]